MKQKKSSAFKIPLQGQKWGIKMCGLNFTLAKAKPAWNWSASGEEVQVPLIACLSLEERAKTQTHGGKEEAFWVVFSRRKNSPLDQFSLTPPFSVAFSSHTVNGKIVFCFHCSRGNGQTNPIAQLMRPKEEEEKKQHIWGQKNNMCVIHFCAFGLKNIWHKFQQ